MLIIFGVTLTMIIPLLNILAISLSGPSASIHMTGLDILPKDFTLDNYRVVFSNPNIFTSLINSIFIAVVGVAINITLTTIAAYVLVQPQLVLKKAIMVFLIVMMLFDPGLVPEYLVVQKIGLMGSRWSVILVDAVNVFYLIIMMRYFQGVPQSVLEAARIDGAGHMTILFRVVAPLQKAGIATISMFYAVMRWNEYIKAGIYISTPSKTTLQVILRQFVVENDTASLVGAGNLMNYNDLARMDYTAIRYATIIVAILPILLLYPIVLKYYAKDVMQGSVKE
ncbi:MAG TPA: carbohydrate ABC transporter permease [Feifaniaceae bacterium]|nr:carbohydrate ABC transporter permease [Feifaniaceae bacterium]